MEAALALVVVVALIAGVSVVGTDLGGETRTSQLATRAVRLAARIGDRPTSDLDLLALVGAGLGGATLERLVVYRPADADGGVPPGCGGLRPTGTTPIGVVGWCTAFGPAHLAALADAPASARGCGSASWEGAWCPEVRRSDGAAPGWVGVLLEVRGPGGGGVIADASSVHRGRAVAALDPLPPGRP